jgi:hypothetical protein
MRLLALVPLLCALWVPALAHADSERRPVSAGQRLAREEVDRLRFGITSQWTSKRWRHLGLGVGWSLPQRWYDADGQLLTERSLLNPGDDLERTGLYFGLRF